MLLSWFILTIWLNNACKCSGRFFAPPGISDYITNWHHYLWLKLSTVFVPVSVRPWCRHASTWCSEIFQRTSQWSCKCIIYLFIYFEIHCLILYIIFIIYLILYYIVENVAGHFVWLLVGLYLGLLAQFLVCFVFRNTYTVKVLSTETWSRRIYF